MVIGSWNGAEGMGIIKISIQLYSMSYKARSFSIRGKILYLEFWHQDKTIGKSSEYI